MKLIANHANQEFLVNLVNEVRGSGLCEGVDAAVAYVSRAAELLDLCADQNLPIRLRCLFNADALPNPVIVERFLDGPTHWELSFTGNFYHPKVLWFRGCGAYIGSANLSDRAWYHNVEVGIWYTEEELQQAGLDLDLTEVFDHIDGRCRSMEPADVDAIRKLKRTERLRFETARKQQARDFEASVTRVPGDVSEGHARRLNERRDTRKRDNFVQEWTKTMALLHKLGEKWAARELQLPWVPEGTPVSVEIDQILTWYYETEIHGYDGVVKRSKVLHDQNEDRRDQAVEAMFDAYASQETMPDFIKETLADWAPELHTRLQRGRLKTLDVDGLVEIMKRSHAIRNHAFRVNNSTLGLPEGTEIGGEERLKRFAAWVWKQETSSKKKLPEVLDYVLWSKAAPPAQRLFDTALDSRSGWMLPRLKLSSLGELLGWAHPETLPPRNNRTSRALWALGYSEVRRYGDV